MMANMQLRTSRRYNLYSAALAFLLWGGWAFYINGDFGLITRSISGLAQGAASFIITLIMVRMVSWFFSRLPANPLRPVLPAVLTICCTGSALLLVHVLAGTPRIVSTIAPALGVAFIFCLFTAFKLQHNTNTAKNTLSSSGRVP